MQSATDKRRIIVMPFPVFEAKCAMNGMQYCHAVDLVKRLVYFDHAAEMVDMPISTVGEFHQLQLTDGVFGKFDYRVIFKDHQMVNEIVVLKTLNMEGYETVQNHWLTHAEIRFENYLERGVTSSTIVYCG